MNQELKNKLQIQDACEQFIQSLGTLISNDEVFIILAEIAEKHSLCLNAVQQGIRGTYVFFSEVAE